MSITQFEQVLVWCFVFNYGLLILWWVIMRAPHDWIYKLWWSKTTNLSQERFDEYNFQAMIIYKLANIFFVLVPYVALRIVMG